TLYDAFGQRLVTQYVTQRSSYYVVMEVRPELAGKVETFDRLYVRATNGRLVPLSTFVQWSTANLAPLSVSHQSLFPAVTISFNLAPGAALGDAVAAVQKATAQMGLPGTVQGSFQGTAQAFQSSLGSQ